MSAKPTGGAAFPSAKGFSAGSSGYGANTNYKFTDRDQGMSLRDYFAAKAMQGMVASIDSQENLDRLRSWSKSQGMSLSEFIARDSYKQADAMIAVREEEVRS